jgi:hypothetical protein
MSNCEALCRFGASGCHTDCFEYLDWQHFYGGSFLFPIKMKFVLAILLLVLLTTIMFKSLKSEKGIMFRLILHLTDYLKSL